LCAEPVEILDFEHLAGEGVADVGVKPGGDDEQIGLECFKVGEGVLKVGAVFGGGGGRWDGVVAAVGSAVAGAGAGVGGMLVDGDEEGAGLVEEDVLGTVAVVDVEVEDGDALDAPGAGGECGDGGVVEIAEAHGAVAGGVVTGRAHEAEGGLAGEGELEGGEGGGCGAAGVEVDLGQPCGVHVEVTGFFEALEVGDGVGAEEVLVGDLARLGPLEGEIGLLLEACFGGGNALGPLRVTRGVVTGATFIRDDRHGAVI